MALQITDVLDADGHLYERRDLWVDYADPAKRHLAVRVADDALGYPWLTYQGKTCRGAFCWISPPGARTPGGQLDLAPTMGAPQRRARDGIPAETSYDDMPASYHDPAARRDALDRLGVAEAVLFPQWGIEMEAFFFDDDLEGLRTNLEAWNRWVADVVVEGRGRLHPVGHVSLLGDLDWFADQVRSLSSAGVRIVMLTPGVVEGRRPSHPDLDGVWRHLVEHGMTVAFHASNGVPRLFDRGWFAGDHDLWSPMSMGLFDLPPQMALKDMALNGVFARHPELRVSVAEHRSTTWIRQLLQSVDYVYEHTADLCGWRDVDLAEPPSAYIKRQVRFGALEGEDVVGTAAAVGDLFMFGADWPHIEGSVDASSYAACVGDPADLAAARALYHDNAAFVLHRS